jgi:hypothetical protein
LAAITSRNDEFGEPVEFRAIVTEAEKAEPKKAPPAELPPLPNGRYGLAQFVRETVLARIPNRAQRFLCAAVAENFTRTAAQIENGSSTTIDDASLRLRKGNRSIIAVADHELWRPVFQSIDRRTEQLNIRTLNDWHDAFSEIGRGFRAAGVIP